MDSYHGRDLLKVGGRTVHCLFSLNKKRVKSIKFHSRTKNVSVFFAKGEKFQFNGMLQNLCFFPCDGIILLGHSRIRVLRGRRSMTSQPWGRDVMTLHSNVMRLDVK